MGGTGLVCRSVRRMMREILQYTFQQALSSEHTQSSEFTHVMLCYIAGERNLTPALPFGSYPHPLLVVKCRTPSIFLSSPLPVEGMSASSKSHFLSCCL